MLIVGIEFSNLKLEAIVMERQSGGLSSCKMKLLPERARLTSLDMDEVRNLTLDLTVSIILMKGKSQRFPEREGAASGRSVTSLFGSRL